MREISYSVSLTIQLEPLSMAMRRAILTKHVIIIDINNRGFVTHAV